MMMGHSDAKLELRNGSSNRSRGGACPPPRNVAANELAMTDSLKSATLWGGWGRGNPPKGYVLPLQPVNGYSAQKQLPRFQFRVGCSAFGFNVFPDH